MNQASSLLHPLPPNPSSVHPAEIAKSHIQRFGAQPMVEVDLQGVSAGKARTARILHDMFEN